MRPRTIIVAFLLIAAAVLTLRPVEAQAPANCSPANLNNWYGYQYNQQVRSTWDSYTAQSRGVCVMKDGQTPAPAGQCLFAVEKPWWTASGSPPSPALCWWGTPTVPTKVVNAPAGCFPTSLSGRPQYSDPKIRALWDSYTAQTVGFCESTTSMPQDCRFLVQEAATKWLCWWPAKGGESIKQLLDRSAYQILAEASIAVDAVCDFVGTGRTVVEFRVSGERVQVLVEGCTVKDIQWLTPPMGCQEADPQAYAALFGQSAIDAGLASAADVCLLPRVAQAGECATALPLTATSTLCFYGRNLGGTSKAAVASFLGDTRFFIDSTFDAVRALVNAADLNGAAKKLVCDGKIALNADTAADRAKLKAAQSKWLKDRLCKDSDASFGPLPDNTIMPTGGLAIVMEPHGTAVLNDDGVRIAYEGGHSYLLNDRWDEPLDDQWTQRTINRLRLLSQPPAAIEDALGVGATTTGKGLDALLQIRGLDPAKVFEAYTKPDPVGPFGDVLHFGVQTPKGQVLIGPYTDQTAPPESILDDLDGWDPSVTPPEESLLDDIEECRPICSLPRDSGAFQPGGAPYLGGANAGLGARQTLLGAGMVGGFA